MLDSKLHTDEFGGTVENRLTVEWLLSKLKPEEAEILWLHEIEEMTFSEIGTVIGLKYRGKELTGSAIRYHKDKIYAKLHQYRDAIGL